MTNKVVSPKKYKNPKEDPNPSAGAIPKSALPDLAAQLEEAALPLLRDMGLALAGLKFPVEGGRQVLRIYIDKDKGPSPEPVPYRSGVTLDDCANFSKALSQLLDDLESGGRIKLPAHVMEVSSPGLDRPLTSPADFERFRGHPIKAKIKIEGRNVSLTGLLEKGKHKSFALRPADAGERIEFEFGDVAAAKLVFQP